MYKLISFLVVLAVAFAAPAPEPEPGALLNSAYVYKAPLAYAPALGYAAIPGAYNPAVVSYSAGPIAYPAPIASYPAAPIAYSKIY